MPIWLNWFMRRFTKYVANPMTLRQAGRPNHRTAALHHVGRKSGRPYLTPLAAEPVEGAFVIPLPYGDDTDWCRNLLAAGHATLDLNGDHIPIINPMVVEIVSVRDQVRPAQVRSWARLGIRRGLRVDRAIAAGVPRLRNLS